MAQLSAHPYIVSIYHADVAPDGRPYLIMEYCSGPNLGEQYKQRPFSVVDALRVAIRVSSAVATAHQAGTIRFGTDPASSALDVNCRAHEVDNLYVVDTSFFPSIGAVNPSLTTIANALRVGDHVLQRLG